MIIGHKPNGYTVTMTGDGLRVEGETRQCVHCQTMWTYQPGSGIQRGWCLRCNGYICAQPQCLAEQAQRARDFPGYDCMPFDDWNKRLRDRYERHPRFAVLPSGIVVERDHEAPRDLAPVASSPRIVVP